VGGITAKSIIQGVIVDALIVLPLMVAAVAVMNIDQLIPP
jgi:hypothetical protein